MNSKGSAHCLLDILGIHTEPLRKMLKDSGHGDFRDMKSSIQYIHERTLTAAKKAFKRHKEYIWEQRKRHKFGNSQEVSQENPPNKPPKPPIPKKGTLEAIWGIWEGPAPTN